jgi:MYXO-CTERM domain-containing protein
MLGRMKAHPRKTHSVRIPSSRWLAYAGAGAATALTGAPSAQAEVHYSGHVDVTFRHDVGAAFFHAGGQQSGAFVGYFIGFEYAYVSRIKGGGNRYISQGYFIADLRGYYFGTMAKAGGKGGNWKKRGTDFVGFRFNNGAGVQYGWARVHMGGQNRNFAFTVLDYAWGDPGEKIRPGQTSSTTGNAPVEGSLGALALGAAGVAALRQRRNKSVAPQTSFA